EHVDHALVGGVATGEQLAAQQQHLARLPAGDLFAGDLVQVDAAALGGVVGQLRPVLQRGRLQRHRAAAVQGEVGVPGGGAVGDHRHRQVGGMGRVVLDLHVQHGGQAAQALGADAEGVDLLVQLQPQLLGAVGGAAGDQLLDV